MPHVASFFRGISLTVAVELTEPASEDGLLDLFEEFYSPYPFVEVGRDIPEVVQVRGTSMAVTSPRVVDVATGEQITFEELGGVDVHATLTDAEGVMLFELTHAGRWYLRLIHMVEVDEEGVDYESNWATLTFEVN